MNPTTNERRTTTCWKNNLTTVQRIVLKGEGEPIPKSARTEDGRIVRWTEPGDLVFTIPPGETAEVPARFDPAIHIVTACGHPACRQGRCVDPGSAGEGSIVSGGLAPRLTMKTPPQVATIDHSLLPPAVSARRMGGAPGDAEPSTGGQAQDADPALARARARRAGAQ